MKMLMTKTVKHPSNKKGQYRGYIIILKILDTQKKFCNKKEIHELAQVYALPGATTQALAYMKSLGYVVRNTSSQYKLCPSGRELLKISDEKKQFRAIFTREQKTADNIKCCICGRKDALIYFKEAFYCPYHLNTPYKNSYNPRNQSSLAFAQID